MNKDAFLATVIGFFVGLIIMGLILIGPKIISLLPSISLPKISMPSKAPTPTTMDQPQKFQVTIDSPLEDSIENSSELLVSGTSLSGTIILIQTDTDDAIVLVNGDGKYAEKVSLVEGKNDITVTGYKNNEQQSVKRTVFYTAEELE